eukprot:PhM_4_TR10726/c0_g1_i1/m.13075
MVRRRVVAATIGHSVNELRQSLDNARRERAHLRRGGGASAPCGAPGKDCAHIAQRLRQQAMCMRNGNTGVIIVVVVAIVARMAMMMMMMFSGTRDGRHRGCAIFVVHDDRRHRAARAVVRRPTRTRRRQWPLVRRRDGGEELVELKQTNRLEHAHVHCAAGKVRKHTGDGLGAAQGVGVAAERPLRGVVHKRVKNATHSRSDGDHALPELPQQIIIILKRAFHHPAEEVENGGEHRADGLDIDVAATPRGERAVLAQDAHEVSAFQCLKNVKVRNDAHNVWAEAGDAGEQSDEAFQHQNVRHVGVF